MHLVQQLAGSVMTIGVSIKINACLLSGNQFDE